jgi:hypothetical protein
MIKLCENPQKKQNKTHVQVAVRTEMGIDSTARLKQTVVSR